MSRRPDEQDVWIKTLLARKPALVGVYAQPAAVTREPDWLPADHAIVFVGGSPAVATALLTDAKGIVRVYTDISPTALLTRIGGALLLPASTEACPVTLPNGSAPPGEPASEFFHGNGTLWTVLWPDGKVLITSDDQVRASDGALTMKFPWWRGIAGPLSITGRRLDAPSPPLQAMIPEGYGEIGIQASGLIFPTAGCWEVTGRGGRR